MRNNKFKEQLAKFIILAGISCLSLGAQARADMSQSEKWIKSVNQQESAGDFQGAALSAAQIANSIADQEQIDQVVENIQTTLHAVEQEVVTSTSSASANFSLLGLISGSADASYDVTKVISLNPEEQLGFSQKVADDWSQLQRELTHKLQKDELALAYMKIFAAKAVQMTAKVSLLESEGWRDYVERTAQRVGRLQMKGSQSIVSCTEFDHAETKKQMGFSISGLLASLSFGALDIANAYNETNCSSEARDLAINESQMFLPHLIGADKILSEQMKVLSLKELTNATSAPQVTWGLPAMN